MKIKFNKNITAILLPALILLTGGCGHSEGRGEAVAETITAEDMMLAASVEDPGDVLSAQEEKTQESVAVDTPAAPVADSVANTVVVSDSVAPIPQAAPVRTPGWMNYAVVFNDSNHFQMAHAKRLGITPITDIRSYYHNRRPLVKIASNENYMVDNLTHSYPYLVPEADRLLQDIGKNFRDSLRSRGIKEHRIVVTSVLRTPATVKKLRQVNVNATEMSTHQYATTFDLSYNKFALPAGSNGVDFVDLRQVLAEVLDDLRSEGRCLVKYEIKSPCFHITVAR